MDGIIQFLGAHSCVATRRPSRSRSRASARCAAQVATRTGTIISAVPRRSASCATSRDRRSIDGVHALIDRHKPLHVSIVGGEPLVRFRELDDAAAAAVGAWPARAGRHERRAADSNRVGDDPAPFGRRVDRRPAGRTRRAPGAGDLRSHPQAHRRAAHRRALHGDAAARAARRLSRGVRGVLAGAAALPEDLVQPLHAADRRGVGREADARGSPRRRGDAARAATALSEDRDAEGHDRGLREAAGLARRMHLRARDAHGFRRPDDAHHALPVRRAARLRNCGCIASAGLGAVGRYRLSGRSARRAHLQRLVPCRPRREEPCAIG